jgi:HAD superfamily hydrolase (TIGR01484 family)
MVEQLTTVATKYRTPYLALAFDYDGTLALDGRVDDSVVVALRKVVESGRRLILVTGRRLEDLLVIFPAVDMFDMVVCENGAILYSPGTKAVKLLAQPAPKKFVDTMRAKGVDRLEIGRVILATWTPNEGRVLDAIQELGLDWQVTFNKGAVMVLPPGVNKATGLSAALRQLGLSRHNVVAVGDAENDLVFMESCECAVAVANALPIVKSKADLITKSDHGAGVIELVDELLLTGLSAPNHVMTRHELVLGTEPGGKPVKFSSENFTLLLAGPSQSGKSTICRSLIEQLTENGYQYCAIDPEGDYDRTAQALTIGNSHYPPDIDDIMRALENPDESLVVNMLGLAFADRPRFVANLLLELHKMRQRVGHPHWLVIDEAHHVLHPYWNETVKPAWENAGANILLTIHPHEIASSVLASVDLVVAVGENPQSTLDSFATSVGQRVPILQKTKLGWGEAVAWFRHNYGEPLLVEIPCSALERKRHARKYANGDVGKERSFYFTGPDKRLNIRVQNLIFFKQVADGVDDCTWLYHLRKGDFSNWFANVINDQFLAEETRKLEKQPSTSASQSRAQIGKWIEERYTLPTQC